MNKSRKLAYLLATMAGICLLSAAALAAGYGNAPQPEPVNDKDGSLFLEALVPIVTQKIRTEVFFRVDHAYLALKTAAFSLEVLANPALKMAVFSLVHAKNV